MMQHVQRFFQHDAFSASWRSLGVNPLSRLSSSSRDDSAPAASFYDSTVERYASQPVEVLSLFQMLQYGRNAHNHPEKILKSARYVQRELPKRLARRLLDLQLLPYIVVTNPHIKKVYDSYYHSFTTLRQLPPVTTLDDNVTFSNLLRKQLDQHALMLDSLATGLREVKSKQLVGECLQLDAFFDSMLRSRISRRVIAEQHLQLADKRPGFIGIIETDLEVADAVDLAAQKTRQVCMETYGVAPEVIISGDKDARVPYIATHLDYMLYEVMKNAARAVVEHHAQRQPHGTSHLSTSRHNHHNINSHHRHQLHVEHKVQNQNNGWTSSQQLPPLHVRICAGRRSSDLTIRISDQGGGIPPHIARKVWSYGFTTVGGIPAGYTTHMSAMHKNNQRHRLQQRHQSDNQEQQQQQQPQHWSQPSVPSEAQGTMLYGVLPTGYAAAGSHTSFWHAYSPSTVASGPYAPVPIAPSQDASQSPEPDMPFYASPTPTHDDTQDLQYTESEYGMHESAQGGTTGGDNAVQGGVDLSEIMGSQGPADSGRFRMAGLGFGLPLSRLYARYFGGDLTLQVVPSYGTDAYLTIRRLEDNEWREEFDPMDHR